MVELENLYEVLKMKEGETATYNGYTFFPHNDDGDIYIDVFKGAPYGNYFWTICNYEDVEEFEGRFR